jgi:N,N'-diacetyllegionaminate synthase
MDKVFIIAEAGVNHNGDINLAHKLIDEAVLVGADAIKFQTFNVRDLITLNAQKAHYQKRSSKQNESQFDMLKKLQLSKDEQKELYTYCNFRKIKFLSSPFDLDSIEFLISIGLDTIKIPSGEITNLPYLRKVGSSNKMIILSTGMCILNEVKNAVDVLTNSRGSKENIILLHCNTEYPTPFSDVNLNAMLTLREIFNMPVGYSDHTLGIEVPIAAVALGARVIEKHFTLDIYMKGPDHKASLDSWKFRNMVESIRNIEMSLGDGVKRCSPSEQKNKNIVRKSIVAKVNITKGDIFTEENITVKRPGLGISPMQWDNVIGLKAKKDFNEDEFIEL